MILGGIGHDGFLEDFLGGVADVILQEDREAAVEHGVGIAVLPDYCVQPESGLMRLLPQADMPEMDCFLVYTEELKNVARVHAFRDFLVSTAQRWRY